MQTPCVQRIVPAFGEDHVKNSIKYPDGESHRSTTPPLPLDCEPLSHQVAGHVHGKGKTKIGMLQYKDGTILKPFQRPSRGQREAAFYHRVFYPDPTLHSSVPMDTLQTFIPRCYGTVVFKEDPTLYYLKLEDVTKKYRKPCIMDVKVGCQTYEDSATQFKKENAKIKYPNMLTVGFQISGMRIYYANSNKYEYYDKSYGRHFEEDTVIEGFKRFFQTEDNFQFDALTEILYRLNQLEDWFVHQRLLHFISSSILFVYEGDKQDSVLTNQSVDTVPELLPKNHLSKAEARADELLTNDKKTNTNGIQGSWYVGNHATGKHVVNGSTNGARTVCMQCCSSSSKTCTPTDLNGGLNHKVPRDNKCNCEFKNFVLLDGNIPDSFPLNDYQRTKPCTPNQTPKNRIVEMEENICPNDERYPKRKPCCMVDLKMIDFTHVIEDPTQDDNYLFGLRKLISNLETLRASYKSN
ncbi:inositol polyphosphate multikinase-like [Anneissia japonica]|uniref:inositol polyphosphate multikinase-like n=1 Tax=Anneissia japonica TaxID=1529436 RepID=UPI0014256A79|nr:inositol polyphosphate multikinase-like [Anneissia japonica]